ncbi:MAG: glycine cleavage system protein GcvH [Armatimonadetes bacterium]|nr:glycine cleavage system protein GcvH [Armatimonadota bacterium]
MQFPEDLKYTETHEWARVEGDLVRVGITSFAIEQLGDVIYLDLPDPGAEVSQGAAFGEIESVKAVSELNAPVSGEVVEVNESLTDDYDMIARDPFGEAWMIVISPSDVSELDNLLDAAAYGERCEEES